MTVKELRDVLTDFDDDIEVMTKKTEIFGNVAYVNSVRKDSYIACSYYGIDAIVVQGDTLLHPFDPAKTPERHILRTPRNRGCLT